MLTGLCESCYKAECARQGVEELEIKSIRPLTPYCDRCNAPEPRYLLSIDYGMELRMLREFYRSWVGFHKIPRDSLHRKKQETASQLMVDNAHAVAAFYQSYEHAE